MKWTQGRVAPKITASNLESDIHSMKRAFTVLTGFPEAGTGFLQAFADPLAGPSQLPASSLPLP